MDTKSLLILRCLLLDGLIETLYIASLDRFSSNPICSLFLEEAWFDRSHPVSTVEIIGIINGRVGGELERLWIEKRARSRNFELTSTLFESLRRGNSFRGIHSRSGEINIRTFRLGRDFESATWIFK